MRAKCLTGASRYTDGRVMMHDERQTVETAKQLVVEMRPLLSCRISSRWFSQCDSGSSAPNLYPLVVRQFKIDRHCLKCISTKQAPRENVRRIVGWSSDDVLDRAHKGATKWKKRMGIFKCWRAVPDTDRTHDSGSFDNFWGVFRA